MNTYTADRWDTRIDLAIDWAVHNLDRSGQYFAAELLAHCQINWKSNDEQSEAALEAFNLNLLETPFTYVTLLPGQNEYFDSDAFLLSETAESGLQLAILVVCTIPLRLKPGITLDMLPRRAA